MEMCLGCPLQSPKMHLSVNRTEENEKTVCSLHCFGNSRVNNAWLSNSFCLWKLLKLNEIHAFAVHDFISSEVQIDSQTSMKTVLYLIILRLVWTIIIHIFWKCIWSWSWLDERAKTEQCYQGCSPYSGSSFLSVFRLRCRLALSGWFMGGWTFTPRLSLTVRPSHSSWPPCNEWTCSVCWS